MEKLSRYSSVLAAFALVLGIIGLVRPVNAQQQAAMIYACVNNSSGTIHVVSATEPCRNNEHRLEWNDTGPIGPAGTTGPQGMQGETGATGATGPQGETGAAGPQGDAGPLGQQGPQGENGPLGPAGSTGAAGPVGPAGAQGETGATGAAGPQGDVGPPGPVGSTGAVGPAGPTGAQGATGAQGPQGLQGPQGPSGVTNAEFIVGPPLFISSTGTPVNGVAIARCPAGKKATGGGFSTTRVGGGGLDITINHPLGAPNNPDGWIAGGWAMTVGTYQIQAYAVCAGP